MNRNSNERLHQGLMFKIEAFEEGVEEECNIFTKKGWFFSELPKNRKTVNTKVTLKKQPDRVCSVGFGLEIVSRKITTLWQIQDESTCPGTFFAKSPRKWNSDYLGCKTILITYVELPYCGSFDSSFVPNDYLTSVPFKLQ